MDSVKQLMASEFAKLREEIIAKYNESGMASTGSWAETVQVVELPNGFSIVADSYINGRKPGKQPPSEAIEGWIKAKGLAARLEKDMSVSSLAYLIARKIAREGWQPQPNQKNMIDSVVTPERIQAIIDKAGGLYINEISAEVTNFLKTIAA
jgi:hypothetical protein